MAGATLNGNPEQRLRAAQALAKGWGLRLYRVDLSRIVSKYIGETEKNLDQIFGRAEHQNVLLFFDEADALFGETTRAVENRITAFQGSIVFGMNQGSTLPPSLAHKFRKHHHWPPTSD